MDQNYFEHDGWSFVRNQDGSLTIERTEKGTGVFGEPDKQMSSIQLPKEDVYRLISYSLSGSYNDEKVINSIKELATKHQLVSQST